MSGIFCLLLSSTANLPVVNINTLSEESIGEAPFS